MKNLLLILLIPSFSFSQTQVDISKAKANAKKYLLEMLNDPAGYQSVGFSDLEKKYTTLENEDYVFERQLKIDSINRIQAAYKIKYHSIDTNEINIKIKQLQSELGFFPREMYDDKIEKIKFLKKYPLIIKEQEQVVSKLRSEIYAYAQTFRPKLIAYIFIHTYRAKNEYNATILCERRFVFDSKLNVLESNKL